MKLLVNIILCAVIVRWCHCQKGNAFVDALLGQLRTNEKFSKSLNHTGYDGTLDIQPGVYLSKVYVSNLLSIRREDDSLLENIADSLHLITNLTVQDLTISSDYKYSTLVNVLGNIKLNVPQIKIRAHLRLANLSTFALEEFKVLDMVPAEVTEFSGVTMLFNWLGARRVKGIIDSSMKLLTDNIETFVMTSFSSLTSRKSKDECPLQAVNNVPNMLAYRTSNTEAIRYRPVKEFEDHVLPDRFYDSATRVFNKKLS